MRRDLRLAYRYAGCIVSRGHDRPPRKPPVLWPMCYRARVACNSVSDVRRNRSDYVNVPLYSPNRPYSFLSLNPRDRMLMSTRARARAREREKERMCTCITIPRDTLCILRCAIFSNSTCGDFESIRVTQDTRKREPSLSSFIKTISIVSKQHVQFTAVLGFTHVPHD
jgi:hypothetical protein